MKITSILSYLILSLMLSNCNKKPQNSITENFPELTNIPIQSKIFVIPGSGCSGCINEIETVATSNVNRDSIYFIFTKIKSLKLFKSKFKGLIDARNVIIDSANKYSYPDKSFEIYPVFYQKGEQSVKLVEYMKPE
jgi:hypothetical protein